MAATLARFDDGEASLRDIIAAAMPHRQEAVVTTADEDDVSRGADGVVEIVYDRNPEWLVHQTELLRHPVYRTERSDVGSEPSNRYVLDKTADGQLILAYPYDAQTELRSTLGELNARDMLVMSAIQQAFYANGCPRSGLLAGPVATFYHIARQIGLSGGEATNLVKASLDRLSVASVKIRFSSVERARRGGYPVNTKGEIVFGLLSGYGRRERSVRGQKDTTEDSFIRLDPTLGDLIRGGHFTFLRAEVLRKLRRKPVALKLYGWARTHDPNERGYLMPYRASTLADRIGCQDTNVTRRRRKIIEGLNAMCAAAPDEFPGWDFTLKTAKTADQVVEVRRRKVAIRGAQMPALTSGVVA